MYICIYITVVVKLILNHINWYFSMLLIFNICFIVVMFTCVKRYRLHSVILVI